MVRRNIASVGPASDRYTELLALFLTEIADINDHLALAQERKGAYFKLVAGATVNIVT
jgi:hypothetical protein